MSRILATGALSFALLLLSAPGQADVVRGPPTNCPPGSRGDSGHEGPACVVHDCSTDAECKGGKVCRKQSLCTHVHEYGHRRQPGRKFKRTVVTSTCSKPADCKAPDTCSTAKRCVPKSVPSSGTAKPKPTPTTGSTSAPPSSSSKCATAAPGSRNTAASWLWLLGLVAALRARRRARA
jgi:MYXO-CTERM domain-containing protein